MVKGEGRGGRGVSVAWLEKGVGGRMARRKSASRRKEARTEGKARCAVARYCAPAAPATLAT